MVDDPGPVPNQAPIQIYGTFSPGRCCERDTGPYEIQGEQVCGCVFGLLGRLPKGIRVYDAYHARTLHLFPDLYCHAQMNCKNNSTDSQRELELG